MLYKPCLTCCLKAYSMHTPNTEWRKYGSTLDCGAPRGKGLDEVSEEMWKWSPSSVCGMLHGGCHWCQLDQWTWWCFCLPGRSERSHIQLPGPTTARACPCHSCSPHLHSGGKNLLTMVTQRALRCCHVKRWVKVNDNQVTRVKSIWPFFLCLHRGWKGRGWAGVEMSCYCWYYQCWWLFQMSWERWTQTEISVPNTVIGHFAMSL